MSDDEVPRQCSQDYQGETPKDAAQTASSSKSFHEYLKQYEGKNFIPFYIYIFAIILYLIIGTIYGAGTIGVRVLTLVATIIVSLASVLLFFLSQTGRVGWAWTVLIILIIVLVLTVGFTLV